MPELIAARIVQGMAGGLLAPLAQLMMARVAGAQLARVMGYAAIPILIAPLLGPLLAGLILKHAHWPWLIFVNLPVGAFGVILAAIFIPKEKATIRNRPFDLTGFLLLPPGLLAFLFGLERFSHHEGAAFFGVGIFLLTSFVWVARRKKERALVDVELFRIRTFSVAVLTQFLSNGVIYCGLFLVPLYLISGAGLAPTEAGWVLSAMGVGMLCVYPMMGNLTDRYECRAVASSGVFVNFLGTLPYVWMTHAGYSMPVAVGGLLLRGWGKARRGFLRWRPRTLE